MNVKYTFFAIPIMLSIQLATAQHSGEAAYKMNCMACHQLDIRVVGPSLAAIAETYPKDKQGEFIKWAQAPGKKDPKLMQMPPMGHVSSETLGAIHEYVLKAAVGKVEKKAGKQYAGFKEPERELPYVVRAFLPDTSPASVAIVLKHNISICWDTEACRFRYAWPGSKTRLRQGHTVVNLKAKPFYRETSDQLWSFAGDTKPEFHGYRLQKDGSPEFAYRIGELEIRECISNGAKPGTIVRQFTLSRQIDELKLNLARVTGAEIAADKGAMEKGSLTLTGKETESFTLTISRK